MVRSEHHLVVVLLRVRRRSSADAGLCNERPEFVGRVGVVQHLHPFVQLGEVLGISALAPDVLMGAGALNGP